MPKLWIDNLEVEVAAGATVLDAAAKLGIEIPTLCYRGGCTPETSCLVCLVKVNGSARLVPACATKVVEGMRVESQTAEVMAARRTSLELLLCDHAGDCLAPCQLVCPAHMDIPRMMRQIQAGQLHEAIVTVKEAIALPAVLGRICPEMCQKACRRGRYDSAVSICAMKRYVADADLASGKPYLPACRPASGKRVAIVGAGPAGLAAAWHLRQMGHACVLFDEHPQAGGNLRYAIGEDRLPREVLDAEIGLIQTLGAEIRCGVAVGRDVSVADLRREFDAVLIAAGEVDAQKAAAMGLALSGKSVQVDRVTMMTPIDGVFAAGGAVMPLRHAVRAVAGGREAAGVIDQYLQGKTPRVAPTAFSVRLGQLTDDEMKAFAAGAREGEAPAEPQVSPIEAASRCLHCDCGKVHDCRLRRYAAEYQANPSHYKGERRRFEPITDHPHVVYESGKCISCGLCVQITARAGESLGLTHIGRGFDVRIGVPFGEPLSQALQRVAEECIDACPTGALAAKGAHDAKR